MTDTTLYPLLTKRYIKSTIWGGTKLAAWLDIPDPHPERIGEIWLVYDTNTITNGALAGRTLANVTQEYGKALVGTRPFAQQGADFPLLAKYLDSTQSLSIQVHPDDTYAHIHEADSGFHGKTEAWYIIAAEPNATVIYGFSEPTEPATFAEAVKAGTVETLRHRVTVKPGDVIFVPAGTVHAIDAGITLFEIQQKSDLTYRLYDFGRVDATTGAPRDLHIEKGVEVSDLAPSPYATIAAHPLSDTRSLLVSCPYFALERWRLLHPQTGRTDAGSLEILTFLEVSGIVRWEGGDVVVRHGESVVLPATLGAYTLIPDAESISDSASVLRVYVPHPEQDMMLP